MVPDPGIDPVPGAAGSGESRAGTDSPAVQAPHPPERARCRRRRRHTAPDGGVVAQRAGPQILHPLADELLVELRVVAPDVDRSQHLAVALDVVGGGDAGLVVEIVHHLAADVVVAVHLRDAAADVEDEVIADGEPVAGVERCDLDRGVALGEPGGGIGVAVVHDVRGATVEPHAVAGEHDVAIGEAGRVEGVEVRADVEVDHLHVRVPLDFLPVRAELELVVLAREPGRGQVGLVARVLVETEAVVENPAVVPGAVVAAVPVAGEVVARPVGSAVGLPGKRGSCCLAAIARSMSVF